MESRERCGSTYKDDISPMKRILLLMLLAFPAVAQNAPNAIEAHIRFLADDLLEGRETGTRGFDVAANYVSSQFDAAGLRPVGGSWFQPIAFRSARVIDQSMSINGTPLTARKDFTFTPNLNRTTVDVTAPVVLAGFGVVAPELHHDDYKMIDARG